MRNNQTTSIVGVLCVVGLLFVMATKMIPSTYYFSLHYVIPALFIICFLTFGKTGWNIYMKRLSILYLWVAFTALFAAYMDESLDVILQMIGSIMLAYCLCSLSNNKKIIPWLYISYLVLYIGVLYYASTHILTGGFDYGTRRMGDELLNANTTCYYTFFATFAIYELGEMAEKKKWVIVTRIGFLLTIPLSFWIAFVTASRQVLLIQIPLISFLFYIRYWKTVSRFTRIITVVIAIVVVGVSIVPLQSYYDNSFLKARAEKNIGEDERSLLLEDAIKIGLENPIVGVGPGNFVHYSRLSGFAHNTFAELFANSGILGFLLYTIFVFSFLKRQWKLYRLTSDDNYLIFFVFGVVFIFDNLFYVFYNNIQLICFFMLVSAHSLFYERSQLSQFSNSKNYIS